MGVTGTVTHDLRGLEARLRLYPQELLAADVRAKNRTASSSRTEAVRLLRVLLPGIKAGTLRRQLKITRASRSVPRATLEFSAKRLRLFGNVPLQRIASKYGTGARLGRLPFRIELADGTPISAAQLTRMFIQRSSSGRSNVWVREGSKSRPIQAVVTGTLSRAYREEGVGSAVISFGRARFRTVLTQEFRYRIAKRFGLALPGSA